MNPCGNKGDPTNRQFTIGKNGAFRVSPCECKKVRVSIDSKKDGRFLRYGLNTDPTHPCETVRLRGPKHLPENTVRTTPCYDAFRNLDSFGTRAFRKLQNGNSKFLGCERLENNLLEEKLIRLVPAEHEELGWHLIEGTDREPLFSLPSPDESIEMYASFAAFAMEIAISPQKRKIASQIALSSHIRNSSAISDLIRLPPVDINHAQIRKLFANGAFDIDLRLKIAAFLLSRNIKSRVVIEHIFPYYDFSEFREAKREIDKIAAKTLPDKLKRLKKAWKTLTAKQRMALRLKYDEDLSHEDAAARLQISVDSFRDRLELAEKKIEGAFPELTRKVADKVEVKPEIQPVIHYSRKTGRKETIEITDRKLTPWGPPKRKENVNKPEIYRWIERECPLTFRDF